MCLRGGWAWGRDGVIRARGLMTFVETSIYYCSENECHDHDQKQLNLFDQAKPTACINKLKGVKDTTSVLKHVEEKLKKTIGDTNNGWDCGS